MAKKILIVDDEPHIQRLIVLSLKKLGCEILTANDGSKALALAASEQPALIVMDVTMPELDGISALKQLKADPTTAKIPVVMLTSRGQVLVREQARYCGAELCLTKPFSPNALAAEAQRIIEAGTPPASERKADG